MKLRDVVTKLYAPRGLTSVLAGINTGDFSVLSQPSGVTSTLVEARQKLSDVREAIKNVTSDWSYWSLAGDEAYWSALVNLLEAAEITGPDNLPDIPFPDTEGKVVMDAQGDLLNFGKAVLEVARKSGRLASSK